MSGNLQLWLSNLSPNHWLSYSELKGKFEELTKLGWETRTIGESLNQKDIVCFSYGDKSLPIMAAYGYPHPDEPVGATALFEFAKLLATSKPDFLLNRFCFEIVLIADVEGAEKNSFWIENFSVENFLKHNYRPIWSGLEVDYAFPIDWGIFFNPFGFSNKNVFPVTNEANSLAMWLKKIQPFVLGLMHNEHVSGSYNFFSHRPKQKMVKSFYKNEKALNIKPHFGEQPDPGKKWFKAKNDFLKERSLKDETKKIQKKFQTVEGQKFAGTVSVAQFLEINSPKTKIITPEIGLWHTKDLDKQEKVLNRKSLVYKEGKYYETLVLPDKSQQTVCYGKNNIEDYQTLGMLYIEIFAHTKWFHNQMKKIWAKNNAFDLDDIQSLDYSRNLHNKRFHTATYRKEAFCRLPTLAQKKDLETRLRFQTLQEIGWGLQIFSNQQSENLYNQQKILFDMLCGQLKEPLLNTPVHSSCQSVLFRWLHYGLSLFENQE